MLAGHYQNADNQEEGLPKGARIAIA